tara:strand:- start:262 stop:915 length:654 start_codon:yes stop_codon:yes gene_type:complete
MKNIFILFFLISYFSFSQKSYDLAVLKYNGGGDWYSNPSALKNLARFCNNNLNMNIGENYDIIEPSSPNMFNYPFIHMTGHGNVSFSQSDIKNLRRYLKGGGFLHIDDNYGMDQYVRTEMKKVFPELNFVELPQDHLIYHNVYQFKMGLPKIHEHDNKPAQGLALIYNNRIICFYSYESDLSDGWEDPNIHGDPDYIRMKALKMGANILCYAMNQTQ